MSEFDPYLKWLGIRETTRPINHYRLLGLELFENDHDVISMAADRQMTHIRTYQNGPNGDISQQLLNELARARRCLLSPDKKAEYDGEIRASLQSPDVAANPSGLPAPPLAVPSPPIMAQAVEVDVVQPKIVDSSSQSGIDVSTRGSAQHNPTTRAKTAGLELAGMGFGWLGRSRDRGLVNWLRFIAQFKSVKWPSS